MATLACALHYSMCTGLYRTHECTCNRMHEHTAAYTSNSGALVGLCEPPNTGLDSLACTAKSVGRWLHNVATMWKTLLFPVLKCRTPQFGCHHKHCGSETLRSKHATTTHVSPSSHGFALGAVQGRKRGCVCVCAGLQCATRRSDSPRTACPDPLVCALETTDELARHHQHKQP